MIKKEFQINFAVDGGKNPTERRTKKQCLLFNKHKLTQLIIDKKI